MSCGNIISFTYSAPGDIIIISDTVHADGILNGKPYYLITSVGPPYYIIYWNGTSWVFGSYIVEDNGSITITDIATYISLSNPDCPVNPLVPVTSWNLISPGPEAESFTTVTEATYTEHLCNCKLVVSYRFFKATETTTVTLNPAGTISGYNYYIFTADFGGPGSPLLIDLIIYYDYSTGQWLVHTNMPTNDPFFNVLAASYSSEFPPSCPSSNNWVLENIEATLFETSLDCTPPIPPPQPNPAPLPNPNDPEECYDILVWAKQCEFAKCVFKYVQKLQYGMGDCCDDLNELMNKKRALEILNCYDSRDIIDDTTDYNFITYSQIKHLLNS
jgi:hypothetical protein